MTYNINRFFTFHLYLDHHI